MKDNPEHDLSKVPALSESDRAWEAEIARRIREIDDGSVEMISWESVRQELLHD